MKNFFYIARFYPEQIKFFDKLGFSRNFSVNKKIKGILNSLNQLKNIKTGVISTTIENPRIPNKNKKFSLGKIQIFTPNYHRNYFRIISYFLNIISTTKLINKRFKINNNSYFICWDFLPDTILPILFSNVPLKNVIMDIEELIQNDPEANIFFKFFEKIIITFFKFDYYFLASKSLIINKQSKNLVINGFYSENVKEEKKIINMLKKPLKKKSFKVFYTGRLDKNRGSDLILDLNNYLKQDKEIEFICFCFGDVRIYKHLKKNIDNPNFKIYYEKKRDIYLKKIINTDIALNLLKSDKFAYTSFPSKLIEYFLFSKTIISTVDIFETKNKTIFITDYDAFKIYKKIKFIKNNIKFSNSYYISKRNQIMTDYSTISLKNKLKTFF